MEEQLSSAAPELDVEFRWLRQVLDTRIKLYFGQESEFQDINEITPPEVDNSTSGWGLFLDKYQPSVAERLAVLLALVPHVDPRLLDIFFTPNAQFDRPFSEFGGRPDSPHRGFLPTGDTLLFLLSAGQLDQRFEAMQLFHDDHFFTTQNILFLDKEQPHDPPMSGVLTLTEETFALFIHGQVLQRQFNTNFPARAIHTPLEWKDLVLHPQTGRQVREIETWIQHGNTLLHDMDMNGKIHAGFRALFHGPPGTGKTLAATLLGKSNDREVYRVDVPMVIAGYIGETEKNISKVFRQAEHKGWILFFDEADALFGKHSDATTNQVTSYLLQCIEMFSGVAILAASSSQNIDHAFLQHLEASIAFPMPNSENRLRIWQQGIPSQVRLAPDIDLERIAERFELSGGAIMNAIRFASLEALRQGSDTITLQSIQQGIRREFIKSGQVI